jgi:hypothetical protein
VSGALYFFNQPSTVIPLCIVGGMFAGAFVSHWLVYWSLRRHLAVVDRDFGAALVEAETDGPRSSRAARLLLRAASLLDTKLEDETRAMRRWLVRGDVGAAYVDSVIEAQHGRNLLTRLFIAIGHSLTGISLVFTFGLIAYVLASDVPEAIRGVARAHDATAMQSGNESLQHAVALMGVKFSISAVGLFGALILRVVEGGFRGSLAHRAAHSAHVARDLFVSPEHHRFEKMHAAQLAVRDELSAMREEAGGNARQLADRLEKLGSIEVSVKAIGSEVTAHLGSLMKEAVADQIKTALADLQGFAEQLMEQVSRSLRESTVEETKKVLEALQALQKTIESQASSDVEKLVLQMRDMMSGGFQNESQNMIAAMSSLRDVVPKLEEQMRRMTDDVGREMSERADSNRRAQDQMMEQMRSMLAANEASQAASREVLARVLEQSEQSAKNIGQRLASSAQDTVARLNEVFSSRLIDLSAKVEATQGAAADSTVALRKHAEETKALLEDAQATLSKAIRDAAAVAAGLREGLGGTMTSLERARAALDSHAKASEVVAGAATRIERSVADLGARLANEQQILAEQRKVIDEHLPRLLTRYGESLEQQSQKLQEAWEKLAQNVRSAVSGASDELAEKVEELGDHVGALNRTLTQAGTVRPTGLTRS